MKENYKLTIAVVTMNRKDQLIEALEGCFACDMPEKKEVIIVDNNSEDGTKEAILEFKNKYQNIPVTYVYSDVNRGVGGGRSLAFENSSGEFVYFMDDDAVVSEKCRKTFFKDAIGYLERNVQVASLTTRIYDEMWGSDRDVNASSKTKIDNLPIIFKFLGGSHFLRRESFDNPLYFNIKYGSEEYAPSIMAQDQGKFHVFDEHISVIHKPKVNKWIKGTALEEYVESCGCAASYATKKMLYPVVFHPILFAGYKRRCQKYLKQYKGAYKKTDAMTREIMKNNSCGKIKFSTVVNLYREFGLTVF